MRTFIIILVVVAVVIGGSVVYLVTTTPKTAPPLRFPLTAAQQRFVARVPATADAFAFVPHAAVLHAKLLANPVTRDPLLQWTDEQPLPRTWMLGGADVVVWRAGKSTSYAIRFDSFRALLVRAWTLIAGPHDATWDGNILFIGVAATAPRPIDLTLTNGLPEGDALVVQQNENRGAFPPIGRPSFTSLRVTPAEVVIVSRARTAVTAVPAPAPAPAPIRAQFPRGAMLSVAFADPPRILGDLRRLLGTDINALVGSRGAIALYDVDAGTFLPRPKGVLIVPADERGRQALEEYGRMIALIGETAEADGNLLVSFDRTSLALYEKDALLPSTWTATRWTGRIDPVRLVPVLRRLGDNPGLRFAAPRLHRAVRDLRRWVDVLQNAESVEAAESVSGGVEELRVRVASK